MQPRRTPEPLSLVRAQSIAENIVGPVQWHGATGYCTCPGIARHTTPAAESDCKAVCEPVPMPNGTLPPGVYCFHNSCSEDVAAASFKLRRALSGQSPSIIRRVRSQVPVQKKSVSAQFDPVKLAQIAAKINGIDFAWFAARSPIRPDTQTPVSFLHTLYEPGEKVIIFTRFKSQGQHVWACKNPPFDVRELDRFRIGKPYGVWFLANPVTGYFDHVHGKTSRRSWKNVTSWRYLILESDEAEPLPWLAALAQMPLPIAAIYTSGGKSIHAMVRIDAESKAHWDEIAGKIKPASITLGADRKTISAVRLTRLPFCERLGKIDKAGNYTRFSEPQMQTLLYLNGRPDGAPICEQKIA